MTYNLNTVVISCSVLPKFFAIPWTAAPDSSVHGISHHQASLSMGISRQEYWSGLPFPSPGDLPNPGFEPMSSALQADSLLLSHWGSPIINAMCLVTQSCLTLRPHGL